jgi:gas vesicle protein
VHQTQPLCHIQQNPTGKDRNKMADKSYGGDFAAGFIIGTLVGAAAALLLAPQSGEETRGMIREKGIELQERSAELSTEARMRAGEYQAQARQKADQLASQTRDRAAELQKKAQTAIERSDFSTHDIEETEEIELQSPASTEE